MVVEVVGTVDWVLLVVPGRLATVNVGFSVSCGEKANTVSWKTGQIILMTLR